MSNRNKKYNIDGKLISDFDAVSLYPSAMKRLGGPLIGKPKILSPQQLNKKFLDTVSGYFIEVEILKISDDLNFPITPQKT